jgi:hypothetical protein
MTKLPRESAEKFFIISSRNEVMKKWIFSISLSLTVFVFTNNSDHKCDHDNHAQMMEYSSTVQKGKTFQSFEPQYLNPKNVDTGYLSVKPMDIKGFEGDSLIKMKKAFEVLEKVVNSVEFKNRVINFKNNQNERSFASNNGLSNEQIYEIFMDGRETLQQNTPGEMNFFLSLYHKRFSKVIGWTNGSINTININWKFFKDFLPNEVAGNLAHEWTHKIGFDHMSAAEHDSAPYAIGYIVREMGAKYLSNDHKN